MKFELQKQLKDKARAVYGLAEVLKCDVDILRKDASDCNLVKIRESLRDTDITIQKLLVAVGQIEYIIKLDKTQGP